MTMTLDDFIAKWSGKPVDFDGIYPNQCMDLMHQYVYDVLGIVDGKILSHPAAYQVFTDFTETSLFDKIANSPTGVPQKGDIVLFNKTSSNPYGHVCIFVSGDSSKFKSFDANWPVGSLPHIQDHTYGYCLGWLRFKGQLQPSDDEKRAIEFVKVNKGGSSLEGAVKSWFDSHTNRPSLESKANRLQALMDNLTETWGLKQGSDEAEILTEAKTLLASEDIRQKYRDEIEAVVGAFEDDSALLGALHAVRDEIKGLVKERDDLVQKLSDCKLPSGYKYVKSWTIYTLLFKLYKKVVS